MLPSIIIIIFEHYDYEEDFGVTPLTKYSGIKNIGTYVWYDKKYI